MLTGCNLPIMYNSIFPGKPAMTPVEFTDEERTIFNSYKKTRRVVFEYLIALFFQKNTDMTRKKTKLCLSRPNKTLKVSSQLRNIRIFGQNKMKNLGRFPFGQKFRKFRFGPKWKTFFRFARPENSQKKSNYRDYLLSSSFFSGNFPATRTEKTFSI